jgi:membrane associated rhomboid family serine protease
MKHFLEDPVLQGQFRHLLSALGPLLGLMLAVLSLPGITFTGVLGAVVANWASISAFIIAFIPFYLSWKAKEKKEYKNARVASKSN